MFQSMYKKRLSQTKHRGGVGLHRKIGHGFLFCCMYFYTMSAKAAPYQAPSVDQMIKNLATQLPEVWLLITAFTYVMGFLCVINGLMLLKKFAEQRSLMSQEASVKGPLMYLFVGAALIYLPSAINSGLTTFWLDPNPYGYEDSVTSEWTDLYNACIIIVQMIGLIAFIRGLMLLTHVGSQSQPGQVSKALAHIIGGIFLLDLFDFLQMVFATFGLSNIIP